jgi:hypothetical protein
VFAAVRDIRGSVVSHRSALLLHGLPVLGSRPAFPELTVGPRARGSAHHVLLHRAGVEAGDVCMLDGVPVLAVARTVADVGRARPLSTAVSAMDAALHAGLVTAADLDRTLVRCWNWPGIRRAQRAVRLTDGGAESPLETVSRLVMRWLSLPRPVLQPLILDRFNRPLGRLDFYWDEYGVAGEADGRSKYDSRSVLMAEKERQEVLEDCGLVFVRWGWDEPVRRPRLLKARIEAAFERGRQRDRSGFPRLWSVVRS